MIQFKGNPLKRIYVITYRGSVGDFATSDMDAIWETRKAALSVLNAQKKGAERRKYKVVRFEAQP